MKFIELSVGQKLPSEFSVAADIEGARLIQSDNCLLTLLLTMSDVDPEELQAIKKEKIRSYVMTDPKGLFWFGMFKMKAGLSFDCTFDVLKYPQSQWKTRSDSFLTFNTLHILLADPMTKILNAQRLVTMPKRFCMSLYETTHAAIMSNDPDYSRHYNEWLDSLYYFTTDELILRGTETGLFGQME